MNKFLQIAGLIGLMALLHSCQQERKFNERFTMSNTSYRPYDNKFFYDELKKLDPNFIENKQELKVAAFARTPHAAVGKKSAYVCMLPNFIPSVEDIASLKKFVERGNDAFLFSYGFSQSLKDSLFYQDSLKHTFNYFPPNLVRSTYETRWINAINSNLNGKTFTFPGHTPLTDHLDSVVALKNSEIQPLLQRRDTQPQLLKLKFGKGYIYYCNAPMMFSNYFLLHKDNYQFFNQFVRETRLDKRHLIWDDYYRYNQGKDPDSTLSKVLAIIHKYPPLRWAFYLFLSGLALFILVYVRRVVAKVPVKAPLKNSSLDFAGTLSTLYWNRRDHAAIAAKIVQHLHEHLLSKFHIYPNNFTYDNVPNIAVKTNVSENLLRDIIRQTEQLNAGMDIDKNFLSSLYANSYKFYEQAG